MNKVADVSPFTCSIVRDLPLFVQVWGDLPFYTNGIYFKISVSIIKMTGAAKVLHMANLFAMSCFLILILLCNKTYKILSY